jgi:hypothetical protein
MQSAMQLRQRQRQQQLVLVEMVMWVWQGLIFISSRVLLGCRLWM